jgi:hypothetical protein
VGRSRRMKSLLEWLAIRAAGVPELGVEIGEEL